MTTYRLGCAGWGYPDWRGGFYPSGTPDDEFLERYARTFSFVEVNSSYYDAPRPEIVSRWARATPEAFLFSAKFPEDITRKGDLADADESVVAFLSTLSPLAEANRLGPLVLQLPPSFRKATHEQQLHDFLTRWPRARRLAVELRDPSWWTQDTRRMLESTGASLVWSVTQYGRSMPALTADWGYLRLIGDRALTRFDRIQRDLTEEMDHWRARIADDGRSAREWFLVVNNHFMGHGPSTALLLADRLGLPPPDLAAASRDIGQRGLGSFGN